MLDVWHNAFHFSLAIRLGTVVRACDGDIKSEWKLGSAAHM